MATDAKVTDETVREFGRRIRARKLDADHDREQAKKSNGAYRAELKAAKAAGVDPDALRWWLQAAAMEPEDLERTITWQNRVARVMELPVGTQLSWNVETGETVIPTGKKTKQDRKANGKGNADPRAAYVAGYDAGVAGKSPKRTGQQFTGEAATQFQAGWQQGQKDAAKQLGPEGNMQ
jgi:ribosome modulation factor